MDIEREIKVRDAIKYCIENFDSKTATNRIVEFWKDELELQQKQCNITEHGQTMVFNLNNDTMTTEQNEIKSAEWRKKNLSKNSVLANVRSSVRFSEREVDFAYLCGVFNASGIDGLHNEIQRLKELGKEPHNIIEACRNQ